MKSIPWIKSEGQEYYVPFDFRTKTWNSYRISGRYPVETKGPEKYFDPPEIFSFLEDLNNPDRTDNDLMLDCVWNEHGNIEMPITDGLLAMFPRADPDTIIWTIIGKEKTWGEPIYLSEIGYIGVFYREKERTEKEAKDEELSIEDPKERKQYALPSGYSTHGGIGTKTKTAKVDKKEKHKLYSVPDKVDRPSRKKRRHKTPGDLLKFLKAMGVKKSSLVIFKALHKSSWYSHSSKLWVWHSKRHKMGRWCTVGIDGLVDITGLSEKTVKRGLKELKANDVIFERAHGWKGVSNTIWELAKDKNHVNGEKRDRKRSK